MTRVLRKSKRRRSGYTEHHVRQLLDGHELIDGMAFGHGDRFDETAAKTAWDIMGDNLLAEWIKAKPGTRPWAWWRWQSPERRPRVDGGTHPHENAERSKHVANIDSPSAWARAFALNFGLPSMFIPAFDKDLYHEWWRCDDWYTETKIFESQATYLLRHDLLTPAEKAELFS